MQTTCAIDIEMSTREVTEEGLRAEIAALPEELAGAVLDYLGW